jgi:hypothetical protein
MAIRTFNSVGGFSVGEVPSTVILANGDITTGNGTFSGNVQGNYAVRTDSLLHLDGTPWDFQQPAGTADYQIQYKDGGEFGASANFSFNPTTNLLTVNGTANVNVLNLSNANILANGAINTNSNITAQGNVSANYFLGNFQGNFSGNVSVPGTNTYVLFNDSGLANSNAGFTFNKSTGAVNITGNISSGNANLGNLTIANYFTGVLTTAVQPNITSVGVMSSISMQGPASVSGGNLLSANYLTGTLTTASQTAITAVGTLGTLSVLGDLGLGANLTGANVINANLFAGTLSTGAQPNITSIGTLGNLVVTGNANIDGNVNAGNLKVANRVTSSLIPSATNNFNLGGTGNLWANLYVSNINIGETTITTTSNIVNMDAANIANNISVGTLTVRGDTTMQGNATISGNLTVSGNTTYINVTNLDIKDPLISLGGSGSGANATTYDGKDRGMILRNALPNNDPINEALIWKTGSNEFQAISQIDTITNEVVTASAYANFRAANFIGNLSGTIFTSSQPYITSIGNLVNANIDGNFSVGLKTTTGSLVAGGLTYPVIDGTSAQVLSTYGNGNLYWATISTSSLSNGTSNIVVYTSGNVTVSSAGNANVLTVTGNSVIANANVSITNGALTVGNANINVLTLPAYNIATSSYSTTVSTKIRSSTVTTTATTTDQVIASVPVSEARGAIFDIKSEQNNSPSANRYSIATVYCVHNGTAVEYTVIGTVQVPVGTSTGTLGVSLQSGTLYLTVTPASSNSTLWSTQFRTI